VSASPQPHEPHSGVVQPVTLADIAAGVEQVLRDAAVDILQPRFVVRGSTGPAQA